MNKVYKAKVARIGKNAAGEVVIIETQDGHFFRSCAEEHKLRPPEQKKRLDFVCIAIEMQDRVFFQSCAEEHKLRPPEQTKRLYESVCVGDEIEYSEFDGSFIILRNITQDERSVKSFVEESTQYAIVSDFWHSPDNKSTHIECVSPAWNGVNKFDVPGHVALRLLDEIVVTKTPGQEKGTHNYLFGGNVTLEQDIQREIQEKVLPGWSKEQLALLSKFSTDSNHRKR